MPLLDDKIIIAIAVTCVICAAFVAVAFLFFASRTAGKGIKAVQETGVQAVQAAATTIEHLADRGAEIVKPLTNGAQSLLESVADRVRIKQAEYEKLQLEKSQLLQEIERLQSRHIDVSRVRAQLKLALVETSQKLHHYIDEPVSATENGFFSLSARTEHRFLCVQSASYNCHVGIDIDSLSFTLNGQVAFVHGLDQVRLVGLTNIKINESLAEIRTYEVDASGKPKSISVSINDDRLAKLVSVCREKLMEDIQNDQSLLSFSNATAQFGLAFLQACLGPAGLQVVKADAKQENSMGFFDLCGTVNSSVDNASHAARQRAKDIEISATALQADIVELITSVAPVPVSRVAVTALA
jgi:hypothetical protein